MRVQIFLRETGSTLLFSLSKEEQNNSIAENFIITLTVSSFADA